MEVEYLAKDSDTASEERIELENILCSAECKILTMPEQCNNVDSGKIAKGNIQLKPIKILHFYGHVLGWQHI